MKTIFINNGFQLNGQLCTAIDLSLNLPSEYCLDIYVERQPLTINAILQVLPGISNPFPR